MKITLRDLRSCISEIITRQSVLTAYHTSPTKLSSLRDDSGMWFTLDLELAKAYHVNLIYDQGRAFTYECRISGKILNERETQQACSELDIDYRDYAADMASNPHDAAHEPDTMKIVEYTGCDALMHSDYDPRDNNRDVESLFVINPASTAQIVRQLKIR